MVRAKPQSRSSRARLIFPVGRIHRFMRDRRVGGRISSEAAVSLAAFTEYVVAEVILAAGDRIGKKKRILPKHITIGIQNDDELRAYFAGGIIPGGGVLPKEIPKELLSKAQRKRLEQKKK